MRSQMVTEAQSFKKKYNKHTPASKTTARFESTDRIQVLMKTSIKSSFYHVSKNVFKNLKPRESMDQSLAPIMSLSGSFFSSG